MGVLRVLDWLLGLDAVLQQQPLQPVHLVPQPVEFPAQRRGHVHPSRPASDQAIPLGLQLLLAIAGGRGPVEILGVNGRVLGLPGQLDPGVVVPDARRGDDVARRLPVLAHQLEDLVAHLGNGEAKAVEHVPAQTPSPSRTRPSRMCSAPTCR